MSDQQRSADLGALHHKLSDLVESARAGRNLAVALRESATDEQERADMLRAAETCATFGNRIRLSLIAIKSYLPTAEGDAHHEPISPR